MLEHTKQELEQLQKRRLDELVAYATTFTYLAKMLAVAPPTVQGWIRRGRISKAGAKAVERNRAFKGKFPAKYLRPDL